MDLSMNNGFYNKQLCKYFDAELVLYAQKQTPNIYVVFDLKEFHIRVISKIDVTTAIRLFITRVTLPIKIDEQKSYIVILSPKKFHTNLNKLLKNNLPYGINLIITNKAYVFNRL